MSTASSWGESLPPCPSMFVFFQFVSSIDPPRTLSLLFHSLLHVSDVGVARNSAKVVQELGNARLCILESSTSRPPAHSLVVILFIAVA